MFRTEAGMQHPELTCARYSAQHSRSLGLRSLQIASLMRCTMRHECELVTMALMHSCAASAMTCRRPHAHYALLLLEPTLCPLSSDLAADEPGLVNRSSIYDGVSRAMRDDA